MQPCNRAFCHAVSTYSDHETFNPARFLGPSPELDPHSLVFDFRRRIYPGRVFVDSNSYVAIVQTLSVFQIGKVVRDGVEVDIYLSFSTGVVSHPEMY
jgi:hypothetical protein